MVARLRLAKRPSAHIVNARRQFAWNSRGAIEPAAMAVVLDKHLLPALAPRAYVLRPKIAGCGCGCHGAPDIVFEHEDGERFALHRMRGHDVTRISSNPGPAPCIRELQRLQTLQKKRRRRRTLCRGLPRRE